MTASSGGSHLADWCRALESRLQEALNEKLELEQDNRRLSARIDELTSIITGIQDAYLIGKLRSGGIPPELEPLIGRDREADTSAIYLPQETEVQEGTQVEPEGPAPSASWAYPPED